ncbi:MAG: shikimate dehydrogenase [Desulfohalobiaceae bacterium]|nr:shikimate dehydrogenase [Desulfohalobiaceae bacterium]
MALERPEFILPERLFGIIGHPLGHSLSPLIHNRAFADRNLPFVYLAWSLKADALPVFMQSVRILPISGLSVTIPHKENILPLLDKLTARAAGTGAVNTVFWDNQELWGENTDCGGVIAPLLRKGIQPNSVLILGCGGAARACCQGLRELGVGSILIAARNQDRLCALERDFGVSGVSWEHRTDPRVELLINATPLGMAGAGQARVPYPPQDLAKCEIVYDLVYNPLQTRLLQEAKARGRACISGVEMFVHQAAGQFRLWTGLEFSVAATRDLVLSRLS